jgi:predicted cation transporter
MVLLMAGLLVIFLLVLVLPFTVKAVEENLEIFLFVMGLLAACTSGVYNTGLFLKAAYDPIYISLAVLGAGLLFKWLQQPLASQIFFLSRVVPFRIFAAAAVFTLGLISSVITAIIAALILVLLVEELGLERRAQVRFVILACYSIGLGAALTPIGETLSTIAVSKLNQDFFYLFRLLGPEILSALLLFGCLTFFLVHPPPRKKRPAAKEGSRSDYEEIFGRSLKIYFFVMGLTFLGSGFEPLINTYLLELNPLILYWINMVSAILDNATLAAAELSPAMEDATIQAILLGLLISGGMLIPGNIPNIIAANKLKITSKEWAAFGVPVGLVTMLLYYFIIVMM